MPQLLSLQGDKKKTDLLLGIGETVYLRDILERCNIKNPDEFQELLQIVASSVGSPCNPNKLSNTFKSAKGVSIDPKTISKYLDHMEDAFLIEKSMRYDIRGKRHINSLPKYYFQDIGLRNAALDFRQVDEGHIMENVIYNELRRRSFRVSVGFIEAWQNVNGANHRQRFEVDFVADMGSLRYYIQSALYMPDDRKYDQETASLKRIDDAFRRVIITRDSAVPYHDNNGYYHLGLFDFLL